MQAMGPKFAPMFKKLLPDIVALTKKVLRFDVVFFFVAHHNTFVRLSLRLAL